MWVKNSVMKIIDNPPNFNIFTSYQSVGSYDLPMALADLIDNSITAEAKNIVIDQNFFQEVKMTVHRFQF